MKVDRRDLSSFLNILQGSWEFISVWTRIWIPSRMKSFVLTFSSSHVLSVTTGSRRQAVAGWDTATPASPVTAWHRTLFSVNTFSSLRMNPGQHLSHLLTISKHVWSWQCPFIPAQGGHGSSSHVEQTSCRCPVSLLGPPNTNFTRLSKIPFFGQDCHNGSLLSAAFYYNGLFSCYICQTLWSLQGKVGHCPQWGSWKHTQNTNTDHKGKHRSLFPIWTGSSSYLHPSNIFLPKFAISLSLSPKIFILL